MEKAFKLISAEHVKSYCERVTDYHMISLTTKIYEEGDAERFNLLPTYPVGSVVATIVVYYAVDLLTIPADGGPSSSSGPPVLDGKASIYWTFQGCISGQIPLEWIIVNKTKRDVVKLASAES